MANQAFTDALNRLTTAVAGLPAKVQKAVADGIAAGNANSVDVTAATTQVNDAAASVENLDLSTTTVSTPAPTDVPATPSGETQVPTF